MIGASTLDYFLKPKAAALTSIDAMLGHCGFLGLDPLRYCYHPQVELEQIKICWTKDLLQWSSLSSTNFWRPSAIDSTITAVKTIKICGTSAAAWVSFEPLHGWHHRFLRPRRFVTHRRWHQSWELLPGTSNWVDTISRWGRWGSAWKLADPFANPCWSSKLGDQIIQTASHKPYNDSLPNKCQMLKAKLTMFASWLIFQEFWPSDIVKK